MLSFLETLRIANAPLYYFGWLCWLAAVGSVGVIAFTDIQVNGTHAWYKPLKFFLSTAIFVWTMAWFMRHLVDAPNAIVWYSWLIIAFFTFEDIYIALQAQRGQLSHFNISTPLYSGLYNLMAVAAVGISLCTAYIMVLFFSQNPPTMPAAYLWGVRLGLVIFVIFSMQGLAMGARLRHTIGAPDGTAGLPVVNWSKTHGDLRIAHFLGMHALQIVPMMGYFVVRSVLGVWLVAALYAAATVFVFVQALRGKPLIG